MKILDEKKDSQLAIRKGSTLENAAQSAFDKCRVAAGCINYIEVPWMSFEKVLVYSDSLKGRAV